MNREKINAVNEWGCKVVAYSMNNDYSYLNSAIIGFDSVEDADMFQGEWGGKLAILKKEKSQSIYEFVEFDKCVGIDITKMIPNDYKIFHGSCEFTAYIRKNIAQLAEFEDLSEIAYYTENAKRIADELDELGENQIGIVTDDLIYDIVQQYTNQWEYDGWEYIIAVLEEENITKQYCNVLWNEIDKEDAKRYCNEDETWEVGVFAEGRLMMNNLDGWMILITPLGKYLYSDI
jgi:hypothetical protein